MLKASSKSLNPNDVDTVNLHIASRLYEVENIFKLAKDNNTRLDYLKELENWIESKKKEIDVPLLLPSKEKAKKKKSKGVYSTELYLSVL